MSLSGLMQSMRASLTASPLSPIQWDVIKSDGRFFETEAGKAFWLRATEDLFEIVRRIRIVQLGGAHTYLMYVAVLRDRHRRLLSVSFRGVTAQRLREQPVDVPDVLRCLRDARSVGNGPPRVPNVRLGDGSPSEDPRDIGAMFRKYFLSLFARTLPGTPGTSLTKFAFSVGTFRSGMRIWVPLPSSCHPCGALRNPPGHEGRVCPMPGRLSSLVLRYILEHHR